MKYKAIVEIGGYAKGEEVPAEKAEVWMQMYKVSPVEIMESVKSDKKSEPKSSKKKDEVEGINPMLEDYLGRNERVVKKNVLNDRLPKKDLENLAIIEKKGLNRSAVLTAIYKKLDSLN